MYACIHTYRLIDVYASTSTWMCAYILTSIQTCMYTYICWYIHGESCIHNTHIQVDTHVWLQRWMLTSMHVYIHNSYLHNFRVKYFQTFQICRFPVFPEFPHFWIYENLIILEIQKFCKYGI